MLIGCFLPQLTVLLHDSATCDRVRGHAASALINLVNPDSCEKDTLAKYLDPLLQSLLYCLQSAPLQVRAPCLALVGYVHACAHYCVNLTLDFMDHVFVSLRILSGW